MQPECTPVHFPCACVNDCTSVCVCSRACMYWRALAGWRIRALLWCACAHALTCGVTCPTRVCNILCIHSERHRSVRARWDIIHTRVRARATCMRYLVWGSMIPGAIDRDLCTRAYFAPRMRVRQTATTFARVITHARAHTYTCLCAPLCVASAVWCCATKS